MRRTKGFYRLRRIGHSSVSRAPLAGEAGMIFRQLSKLLGPMLPQLDTRPSTLPTGMSCGLRPSSPVGLFHRETRGCAGCGRIFTRASDSGVTDGEIIDIT